MKSKYYSILAVISLIIIIFAVRMGWTSRSRADMGGLVIAMLSFWYIAVIIGMWAFGFLTRYLIKKELYQIAKTISITGLIVFSVFFFLQLIGAITQPHLFNWGRTLADIGGFILFSGWTVIPIIYLIISLILINKAKKGEIKK